MFGPAACSNSMTISDFLRNNVGTNMFAEVGSDNIKAGKIQN